MTGPARSASCRLVVAGMVLAVGVAVLSSAGVPTASALTGPSPDARFVGGDDGAALAGEQPADQRFSLAVPSEARCEGSSRADGYRLYTFLLPDGTDPSAVSFLHGVPSLGTGLVDDQGYFVRVGGVETGPAGQVVGLPTFRWSAGVDPGTWYRVSSGADALVASGTSARWLAGVACVDSGGAISSYWAAPVVFTLSATDPHGFVWRPGETAPASGPELAAGTARGDVPDGVPADGSSVSAARTSTPDPSRGAVGATSVPPSEVAAPPSRSTGDGDVSRLLPLAAIALSVGAALVVSGRSSGARPRPG